MLHEAGAASRFPPHREGSVLPVTRMEIGLSHARPAPIWLEHLAVHASAPTHLGQLDERIEFSRESPLGRCTAEGIQNAAFP